MIYVFYILSINITITSLKVVTLAIDESGLDLLGVEDMYDELKKYIRIVVPIFALLIGMMFDMFFNVSIVNLIISYFAAIHLFDILLEDAERWILSKISE